MNSKKTKKNQSKPIKLDISLLDKIKKNGTIFNKKGPTQASTPPKPQPKPVDPPRKTETSKKEDAVQKSNDVKTKIDERDSSLEEHVDFSVGFEETRDAVPIIRERKKEEEPVKDMEQFLEKVPSPSKKEETGIVYESIDENYLRSYESTYQGRKWDEERTVHEIKENLVRFDHPGRFRETSLIQDPAITHNKFSEQVKYDLERIDRLDNDRSIFKPVFEKKYKSRGKL